MSSMRDIARPSAAAASAIVRTPAEWYKFCMQTMTLMRNAQKKEKLCYNYSLNPPKATMTEAAQLRNCTYRYSHNDVSLFATWIDGPCTVVAVLLALVGAHFAVRFLRRAGLNRGLTAALFALCLIDSLLMLTVFFFYSIEATSIALFKTNVMYNRQAFTTSLHGIVQSFTTSSTLLVIWVTLQRFLVVLRPMRYAKAPSDRSVVRRVSYANNSSVVRDKKASLILNDTNGNASIALTRNSSRRGGSYRTKRPLEIKKWLKAFIIPGLVVLLAFVMSIPIYFEFVIEPCWDWEHGAMATCPAPSPWRIKFLDYRSIMLTLTQTIGPVGAIAVMTALTEYKVHRSLRERRKLFESRNRNVVLTDELRERVSRTVAVFITVKFLVMRSMPFFFDVYEKLYSIESFTTTLSMLVRISDFLVVLNSATNSLAYFGKKTWLEKRLRTRLIKKEERKQRKNSFMPPGQHGSASVRKDSELPAVENRLSPVGSAFRKASSPFHGQRKSTELEQPEGLLLAPVVSDI